MKLKTLSIPEDLHSDLRIHAALNGYAIGDAAVMALRYWLNLSDQAKAMAKRKKNGKR